MHLRYLRGFTLLLFHMLRTNCYDEANELSTRPDAHARRVNEPSIADDNVRDGTQQTGPLAPDQREDPQDIEISKD